MKNRQPPQGNIYLNYYNPNDISKYLDQNPVKFMGLTLSAANGQIPEIYYILELILNNPHVKSNHNVDLSQQLTLETIIQIIIGELYVMHMILKLWHKTPKKWNESLSHKRKPLAEGSLQLKDNQFLPKPPHEYNPDNLGAFLETDMFTFIDHVHASIEVRADVIDSLTIQILEHPNIDQVANLALNRNMSLKDALNIVLDQTYIIRRILLTAVAYKEAYERGEVNPKDE